MMRFIRFVSGSNNLGTASRSTYIVKRERARRIAAHVVLVLAMSFLLLTLLVRYADCKEQDNTDCTREPLSHCKNTHTSNGFFVFCVWFSPLKKV